MHFFLYPNISFYFFFPCFIMKLNSGSVTWLFSQILIGLNCTVSSQEDYLKLVHNYGPCSPRKHGKANAPSAREILERDQTRMSFKKSRRHGKNHVRVKWDSADLEYVVNVGLGTPKREFTLAMDTGSSLIWTQCQPCKILNFSDCFKQIHPIFDPSKSSTYTNITCPSHICSLANTTLGN